MTFWAQIIVGGELTTKTVPVRPRFCTVANMLAGVLVDNHAEFGRLATRPTGHSRGGHPTAPQHWGHLSVVEDRIRSEKWEILKGRVESLVRKSQFQESWDPNRPWAAVIGHPANWRGDMSWWFSHVDKPCFQSPSVRGSTALFQILEGGMPTLSDVYDGTSRAGGRTPGQKRNKRDSYLTKRGTALWAGGRPDGSFLNDGSGRQVCYTWNRRENGCSESCVHCRSRCEATTDQSPTSVPRNGDRRTGDPNWRPVAGTGAEEAKEGD